MFKTVQRLRSDESGVSPVIGVILMVAITVILAAVIAAFVLGFGADQESAPQASWSVTQDVTEVVDTESEDVTLITFRHTGGESIDADTLTIRIDSTGDDWSSYEADVETHTSNDILTAGDTITLVLEGDVSGTLTAGHEIAVRGDEVSLIWESGEDSSILRTFELTSDIEVVS